MRRLIEFYLDGERSYFFNQRPGPMHTTLGRYGLLWNWSACWVGVHYSPHHRRLCVNVVPFLTIWYTKPGGILP